MLLPTTYTPTLLVLLLTALLWGVWASTQRADKRWRFELYAFDFAFGALLITLALALTAGNAGVGNNFTFDDSLTVASKRNMAAALAAGVIFCLGNIMILAGVVLAGMSTALLVSAAMAMVIAVLINLVAGPAATQGSMVYGGMGLALAVLVIAAMAQRAAAAAVPAKRGLHAGWKGYILSCVGGLIIAVSLPIAEYSRAGDIGVGAYGVALFMSVGVLLMTPLVNVYFLNLPVQGDAESPVAYFKGTKKQHLMGLLGGAMWGLGTAAFLAGASGGYPNAPRFLGVEALGYGFGVTGAICGLLVWGEQAEAGKAKGMLMGGGALLAAAAALVFLGS